MTVVSVASERAEPARIDRGRARVRSRLCRGKVHVADCDGIRHRRDRPHAREGTTPDFAGLFFPSKPKPAPRADAASDLPLDAIENRLGQPMSKCRVFVNAAAPSGDLFLGADTMSKKQAGEFFGANGAGTSSGIRRLDQRDRAVSSSGRPRSRGTITSEASVIGVDSAPGNRLPVMPR